MKLKDRRPIIAVRLISPLALAVCALFIIAGDAYAQAAPPSGLKLIGTMEGGSLSGAVFQDASGQQVFYQLNDKLPDGSRIVRLRADSISLKGPDGAAYDMFIARDTKTPGSAAARDATPASQPAVSQQPTPSKTITTEEPGSLRRRTRPGGESRAPRSPGRKTRNRPASGEE